MSRTRRCAPGLACLALPGGYCADRDVRRVRRHLRRDRSASARLASPAARVTPTAAPTKVTSAIATGTRARCRTSPRSCEAMSRPRAPRQAFGDSEPWGVGTAAECRVRDAGFVAMFATTTGLAVAPDPANVKPFAATGRDACSRAMPRRYSRHGATAEAIELATSTDGGDVDGADRRCKPTMAASSASRCSPPARRAVRDVRRRRARACAYAPRTTAARRSSRRSRRSPARTATRSSTTPARSTS